MKIINTENTKDRLERIIRREMLPRFNKDGVLFSDDFIKALAYNSELVPVHKNELIQGPGLGMDFNLIYIKYGIASSFYYEPTANKTIITKIWKKHDIIFDLDDFLNGETRSESHQMLEDGELLAISYTSLRILLETFPNTVSFLLELQVERERQYKYYQHLLRLNVQEKVNTYLNDNPSIYNRINKEYIASHLGISRSRLSKATSLYKQGFNGRIVELNEILWKRQ
ncbi:Crp/Fnr family transcriptional regulator [Pedobacter hartonius]|uniref:cAMP-binding domain of CRP or a regulatory subunit of cAMP-dependent protein kinases n=1 Tax=Pedobacter hartonius TaxID=425514 RepID=A0A1H4CXT7_9SPHI|nr:Crp/Fnr family transcriptional regulator [Pedobacter hartonius]SEA65303.1 cAMP-binding domain of CRP or a regulatory subunit of cAMP-dependent protein kinases [Pedobacter hartonius]